MHRVGPKVPFSPGSSFGPVVCACIIFNKADLHFMAVQTMFKEVITKVNRVKINNGSFMYEKVTIPSIVTYVL